MAAWVACRCRALALPHFDAAGVAALLEQSHREADDQHYLSAQLGQIEMVLIEAAQQCRDRQGSRSRPPTWHARCRRRRRHDYLEQCVQDSIREGERLISTTGQAIGQLNAMSQVDTGDHRFGVPMRISARTLAGHQGVLNIEREVRLSGPIHDKGVLILQGYLNAWFSELAPLALRASLVSSRNTTASRATRPPAPSCLRCCPRWPGCRCAGHRGHRRAEPAWRGAARGRASTRRSRAGSRSAGAPA
jgi:predicted ATP-dependent protease